MRYTLIISNTKIMHFSITACAELYQKIYGGVIINNFEE
jgi:hypothetical protein